MLNVRLLFVLNPITVFISMLGALLLCVVQAKISKDQATMKLLQNTDIKIVKTKEKFGK